MTVAKRVAVSALLVGVLWALVLGAGKAQAGLLGCRYGDDAKTFARWGDYSDYVPVPGGNFESNAGWTLTGGARIVDGNEPFHLRSPSDNHSLLLPPGSSAMSPPVCLQVLTPTIRFVGQASGASAV